MDRAGPYFIDRLPAAFAGYDETLFRRLHAAVSHGGLDRPEHWLRTRRWLGKLTVSVTTVPGQFRMMIMDGSGSAMGGHMAVIFFDTAGEAYVALDRRIPASLIRSLLDAEPSS